MRPIGNLPSEKQARLFGDYLLAQGVRNEVEHDADGSWIVWVLDDDQTDEGKGMLERFRRDPQAREFSSKATAAEQLRSREQQEQSEWRRRVHDRRRVFPDARVHGTGMLTYGLVVACVAVAIFTKLGTDREMVERLLIALPGGGFLPEVMHGQVWRLVTPILFNMMWLFSLGSMIESAQGMGRFALLVAAFALGSNLAQYSIGHSVYFGGMSGVNYGLIGYVWLRGKFDPRSGLHLDRQSVIMAIAWFFLCFSGWMGPIANYAHAGGLVLGMAWGWISARLALRDV
jgi:GlpG protein